MRRAKASKTNAAPTHPETNVNHSTPAHNLGCRRSSVMTTPARRSEAARPPLVASGSRCQPCGGLGRELTSAARYRFSRDSQHKSLALHSRMRLNGDAHAAQSFVMPSRRLYVCVAGPEAANSIGGSMIRSLPFVKRLIGAVAEGGGTPLRTMFKRRTRNLGAPCCLRRADRDRHFSRAW